ncbi:MAG: multicopper oxidase family protein [Bacillus sp. (in: firmicutes)]
MKLKFTALFVFLILILAACSANKSTGTDENKKNQERTEENGKNTKVEEMVTTNTKTLIGNEFNLVAKKVSHQLNNKVTVEAWTFNGSVPGSQIRVKEGEKVKINFKNELPEPTSIHWHGITVPNEMDGIPGVTQNAVQPGETFTYEFTASVPGTYMYHTHQNAVNQLDKGLYGSFIVDPKEKTYDRDYTLMLDEWMSNPDDSSMSMDDMAGMNNMEKSTKSSDQKNTSNKSMAHSMNNYDIFTMNGKSGDAIEPLKVKEGEKVRIRLANIGYLSHNIHLHGHTFKVVAIDGQELNEPQEIKNELISIAPGERYDIEFVANNPGKWYLECHGNMTDTKGMKTMIQYEGTNESKDQSNQEDNLPIFSYTNYGKTKNDHFSLDQKYDVEYTMDLNGNDMDNIWTINGKSFPNIDGLTVKKGDLVKVKLTNSSSADHPMHLHGHSFQILSKNGKALEGAAIIKDTVNVKPGEEYVVAFEANNPGNWLFHCHDLHHATAGMVDIIKYDGYKANFAPDPNTDNKPE